MPAISHANLFDIDEKASTLKVGEENFEENKVERQKIRKKKRNLYEVKL